MDTTKRLSTAAAIAQDQYQLILPVGTFHTAKYGELTITPDMVADMVANWTGKVLGEREPYIDTDHDGGEAQGWIRALEARPDGLYAQIEWTDPGREKVAKMTYRYFSAEIGSATDIKTGEKVDNVLVAVALTNRPVMNTMAAAHLSDGDDPAHGEGEQIHEEVHEVELKLSDVIEYVENAEHAEKSAVLKVLGVDHAQVATLSEQVQALTSKNEVLTEAKQELSEKFTALQKDVHAKAKKDVFERALAEGRILPAKREYWEGKFDENPEFVTELIENLPKAVEFGELGHAGGGEERKFSEAEMATFAKLGLSDEDVEKFGGDV